MTGLNISTVLLSFCLTKVLALDCYVGEITNERGTARRQTCSPIEINRCSTAINTSKIGSITTTIRKGGCAYDTDCTMQKLCGSDSANCKYQCCSTDGCNGVFLDQGEFGGGSNHMRSTLFYAFISMVIVLILSY